MEFVFNDYCNWKLENEKLIYDLISTKSDLISRFKHVYDVVEYYNDEMNEKKKLSEEETNIFESGFNYLYDQFQNLELILDTVFHNDLAEMEKSAELINLYLYSLDFENEYCSQENQNDEKLDLLKKYSDKIYAMIVNKEEPTEELHRQLDRLCFRVFGESYYGVNEIFLDIADELGILDYDA